MMSYCEWRRKVEAQDGKDMKESPASSQKKVEFKRVLNKIGWVAGKVKEQIDLYRERPDRIIYIDLNAGHGGHPGG